MNKGGSNYRIIEFSNQRNQLNQWSKFVNKSRFGSGTFAFRFTKNKVMQTNHRIIEITELSNYQISVIQQDQRNQWLKFVSKSRLDQLLLLSDYKAQADANESSNYRITELSNYLISVIHRDQRNQWSKFVKKVGLDQVLLHSDLPRTR